MSKYRMQYRLFVSMLWATLSIVAGYSIISTYYIHCLEKEAEKYASDEEGRIDQQRKAEYLNTKMKNEAFSFFSIKIKYEDLKKSAIGYANDIKGGVTLVVEPDYVEWLKNYSNDFFPALLPILIKTQKEYKQKHTKTDGLSCFFSLYKKNKNTFTLAEAFYALPLQEKIKGNESDEEIMAKIRREIPLLQKKITKVLQDRLNPFGNTEITITLIQNSGGKLEIEMPTTELKKAKESITQRGKLSLYIVGEKKIKLLRELFTEYLNIKKLYEKKIRIVSNRIIFYGSDQEAEIFAQTINPLIQKKGILLARMEEKSNNVIFVLLECTQEGYDYMEKGSIVKDARGQLAENGGSWIVSITFTKEKIAEWSSLTANAVGRNIAIVNNGQITTIVHVDKKIDSPTCQIQGNFTKERSQLLSQVLASGPLPTQLNIIGTSSIGATLGQASAIAGKKATLLALILIILFMLLYYGIGGLIANVALFFNMLFIFAGLAQVDSNLSMSSIAGFVLSSGMTVDTNVLLWERIREELNRGYSVKKAISIGYNKAYSAIIDGNITTLLIGFVLCSLGRGLIKGFGVTLVIGILSSLFTAGLLTRLMLEFYVYFFNPKTLSLSLLFPTNILQGFTIDFWKKRKIFYTFSILFILLGLGAIWKQGLPWGVDFTGGNIYIVQFSKNVIPEDYKNIYPEKRSITIRQYDNNKTLQFSVGNSLSGKRSSPQRERSLFNHFLKKTANKTEVANPHLLKQNNYCILSESRIDSGMASDIRSDIYRALILAILLLFLYIFLRFKKWQFSFSVIVALIHDCLFVVATYGFTQLFGFSYEFDSFFITACLTLIGYTVNDSIVILDKIRENFRSVADGKLWKQIANKAINQTLSRTLITSFTTLLAVFTLFILGGSSLRGFSYTLLIGIICGTYSSICISVPLALDCIPDKERIKISL